MSRKRRKQHQSGERLSVYLNKDLPPHFFDWLNKQDDVSAFVLYAMQCLYAQTGDVNLSEELPRKFYFRGTENVVQPQQVKKFQPMDTSHTSELTDSKEVEVTPNTVQSTSASVASTELTSDVNEVEVLSAPTSFTVEAPINKERFESNAVSADLTPQDHQTQDNHGPEDSEEHSSSDGQWANLDNINVDNF